MLTNRCGRPSNAFVRPAALGLLVLAVCIQAADGQHLSNPSTVVVQNDSDGLRLRLEMNGYPQHGHEGACDILYGGHWGEWTFSFEGITPVAPLLCLGTLSVSMALDDHFQTPPSWYEVRATTGQGEFQANDPYLLHTQGTPSPNWSPRIFPIERGTDGASFRVTFVNLGWWDWVAVDNAEVFFSAGSDDVPSIGELMPSASCRSGAAQFSISATGSNPLTYLWQWSAPAINPDWSDITEGSNTDSGEADGLLVFAAVGAASSTVSVQRVPGSPYGHSEFSGFALRVIVTNACGSVTSNEAAWTICAADFNCDFAVTSADITSFLSAWFTDLSAGTIVADFNQSGGTTSADITAFLGAWFDGLMTGC